MTKETIIQQLTDSVEQSDPFKAWKLVSEHNGIMILEGHVELTKKITLMAAKKKHTILLDKLIASDTLFTYLGPIGAHELCYYASLNNYNDAFRRILLFRKKLGLSSADLYNMLFLRYTVRNDKEHLHKLLVINNTSKSITSEMIKNALCCAASLGFSKVIEMILENKIIIESVDNEILKATLDVAVKNKNRPSIIKILSSQNTRHLLSVEVIQEFEQNTTGNIHNCFVFWLRKNGYL